MLKFNHEGKTLPDALGLSQNQQSFILGNLFFELIYRDYVVNELYDDSDDAPIEMRTSSGLLENCLKVCSSENERTFMIWEFSKTEMLRMIKDKKLESMLGVISMLFMVTDKNRENFIKRFCDIYAKADN